MREQALAVFYNNVAFDPAPGGGESTVRVIARSARHIQAARQRDPLGDAESIGAQHRHGSILMDLDIEGNAKVPRETGVLRQPAHQLR